MRQKLAFGLLALVILSVPIYLMLSSEAILEDGYRHKLRLEGRDPFDPLRGKFLRLNFDNDAACESCPQGSEIFVTLAKDEDGFSYFDKGANEKPDHSDYFKTKVLHSFEDIVTIETDNLSKYFINEDKAKKAEDVLFDYQRNHPDDIYLAIRVLDGEARLEDIFIEEVPLLEFLEKE